MYLISVHLYRLIYFIKIYIFSLSKIQKEKIAKVRKYVERVTSLISRYINYFRPNLRLDIETAREGDVFTFFEKVPVLPADQASAAVPAPVLVEHHEIFAGDQLVRIAVLEIKADQGNISKINNCPPVSST